MFESIVVGTDGSETASEAVRKAVELAQLCGPAARLHVVSAYKTLESMYLAPEVVSANLTGLIDPRGEAQGVVDEAAAKVRAEGVEVDTYVWPGDAASAILDVAETAKADVIVVGNRGMGGVARFLLGSVPNKVAHHAPCTVLIVRTC
ncbi:MAG TPA: universal stress protein [Acidimicrobiales bacterium]|nr:universal stress protein [Acidimicrobiales bacterium]